MTFHVGKLQIVENFIVTHGLTHGNIRQIHFGLTQSKDHKNIKVMTADRS